MGCFSHILCQYNFDFVALAHSKVSNRELGLKLSVDKLEIEMLTEVTGDKLDVEIGECLTKTDALSTGER